MDMCFILCILTDKIPSSFMGVEHLACWTLVHTKSVFKVLHKNQFCHEK